MKRQSSILVSAIDSETPINTHLAGKYTKSFAYVTLKDRLPIILTKVIDQLSRDKECITEKYGLEAEQDIKTISGKISKLKNEVQTNKSFISIESNAEDVQLWNKYLEEVQNWDQSEEVCWFHVPWLYSENYLYRRLWEAFEMSQCLQHFDPFFKQKQDGLDSVKAQLPIIAKTLLHGDYLKAENLSTIIKLSLWSNRCDLSLSDGAIIAYGSIFEQLGELENKILCDESSRAVDLLKNDGGIIDIVHDNTGLELFSDLILADFLLRTKLAKTVRFHCKKIPWYVSDVTKHDFNHLLIELEKINLGHLVDNWRIYLENNQWQVYDEPFWTLPYPYDEMLQRDSSLYKTLSEAKLVIFKGDLNYRKLLGDINWDPEENFTKVLRRFRPSNVLALRTVKADLIAGVQREKVKLLDAKEPFWMRTGDYGIIQCALK